MMTDEALAKALQQYGKVIRAEIDDLVARSFAVHTADQGELSREVFRAALPKIREGFQSIQPTEQEGFLLRCIRAAAAECEDRSPTSAASQRSGHFAFAEHQAHGGPIRDASAIAARNG